jgi:hypothetical protein
MHHETVGSHRESEKERLVREVENKDMELGSQVRRLHYELKQALLDVRRGLLTIAPLHSLTHTRPDVVHAL